MMKNMPTKARKSVGPELDTMGTGEPLGHASMAVQGVP